MVAVDDLRLPLAMSDFDDSPIPLANHFLIQRQLVVSLSQVTAPPLIGTPDQPRAQARPRRYPGSHARPRRDEPPPHGRADRVLQEQVDKYNRLMSDREPARRAD